MWVCTGLAHRKGVSEARETDPVGPVPAAHIDAVLPLLRQVVADMVHFQRLTGCRPGEVIRITPADADRSGEVWTISLADHKTVHHDNTRASKLLAHIDATRLLES